ncbi:MAG: ATP-binding cassette domain-containing protein [Candidatus Hydrogenedentota bacterium]
MVDISVQLGDFQLKKVSLEVPTGSYAILMGRTGCGKTTLLEILCGLTKPTSGRVELMGHDMTHAKPAEREIGYIPQDGALFNHMTVLDQIGFPLRVRKWSRLEIAHRVGELAEQLSIAHLLSRKPHGLSGGEIQRVAIGRALSFKPSILCLDEPLSALDHETRSGICDLLEGIKNQAGVTCLHITHDINEAARLADRIFTFDNGAVSTRDTTHQAQKNQSPT